MKRATAKGIIDAMIKASDRANYPGTTTIYRDKTKREKQWRWRAVETHSGKLVSESGEGYDSVTTCELMARKYGPQNFIVERERSAPKRKAKGKGAKK